MRLFVGVGVSADLEREVALWAGRHFRFPVRWLRGPNFHITIVPPWENGDPAPVIERLRAASAAIRGPIPIRFYTVSFGPSLRMPRLIWAEGEAPPALVDLRDRLTAALGFAPERRSFRLHLTLARFPEEDFEDFPVKNLNDAVDWQDEVVSTRLYRSHLISGSAEYEVLAEFPLGAK